MRGRVIAVLSLLFLFATTAFPQCSLTTVYSSRFRSTVYDLSIDGDDLWAATGFGVAVFNKRLIPTEPYASIAVPGLTRVVRASNSIAYAGSGSNIVVISKNGMQLSIVRTVDAGGTVNDILLSNGYLFVATTTGIAHFAVFDATNPTRTASTFQTSSANVLSLATSNGTMYAADGDSSIELFSIVNPAVPQKTGTLTSLPRTISVRTTTTRLYVSDGQNTDVFLNGVKAATLTFGATSLTQLAGDQLFVAGNDRRFVAVDTTLAASPVELFEAELPPSGGTVNRVMAMQVSGDRLYVAAGDIGLLTYFIGQFTPAVRGYSLGTSSGIAAAAGKAYVGTPTGLSDLNIGSNGALSLNRNWSTAGKVVRDATNGFLLTSTSNSLTYWTTASLTPVPVWTATLGSPVTSAIIFGGKVYALDSDGLVWSLNIADASPVATQVPVGVTIALMARSASAIALAQLMVDGTTTLRTYANGDLSAAPATATIDGAATSLAIGDSIAAAFTFRGISVVNLATQSVQVLPQSNLAIARALAVSGTTVLELTDRLLYVWNATTRQLANQFPLTADSSSLAVDGNIAVAGTDDGIASIAFTSASVAPARVAMTGGNTYYRKAVATTNRLYLFDGTGVDIYSTATGVAPRWIPGLTAAGLLDLAANDNGLFTLASNGTISAWSRDGGPVAQTTLNEGADAQPLSIWTAGNAVWVSITKGCLSGGCEKKTLVLDPNTLAVTATFTGGVIDLTTSGSSAYVLFDMPSEIRAYSLSDPVHPSLTASRASEGSPVSIAVANGTIDVLGDQLRTYSTALTAGPVFSPGGTADPAQKVRVDGQCGVITGRAFDPLVATAGTWGTSSRTVPSPVKSLAAANGRFFVLTDHSLEIWSSGTAAKPPARRHATR